MQNPTSWPEYAAPKELREKTTLEIGEELKYFNVSTAFNRPRTILSTSGIHDKTKKIRKSIENAIPNA